MTKKDSFLSEDIRSTNDLPAEEKELDENTTEHKAAPTPHTEVKNAHASGDGSYGRSDHDLFVEKGEETEHLPSPDEASY